MNKNNTMKVFISYPPLEDVKGIPLLGQNRQYQVFHNPSYIYPMVPASAATLLSKNRHKVVWNDCIAEGWNYERFITFVKQEKPDLIAIETKTPVIKQHWRIIKDLKAGAMDGRGLTTILMGDHVTALPEETMINCPVDFVITGGDYDFSLLGIVEYMQDKAQLPAGIWYRGESGEIKNTGSFREAKYSLDKLPVIDRELTKWWLYGEKIYKRKPFTYTMAGRDCPWGKCSFCSWTTIYPDFKVRSPESLLDEIEMLVNKYNVREIFDDTGTFPSGKWLETFCGGMIERGLNKKVLFSCNFRFDYLKENRLKLMKRAGFRLFKLGLESANDKTLERLQKGIKAEDIITGCKMVQRVGIEVHLTIMIGYPWETRQDVENTINLAAMCMKKGLCNMLQATVVIPYPGSLLYKQSVENNWFNINYKDYEKFDMSMPVLKTPNMTDGQIMKAVRSLYKTFLCPEYILRYILSIRSIEDICYIFRGSKAVIGHLLDFKRKGS